MNERSLPEKEMIAQIMDEAPPLPYKLVRHKTEYNGEVVMEDRIYIIPDDKKQEVLEALWCFTPTPKLEDVFFDIHENKCFTLKDYRVIRWKGRNIIVSPYYLKSGGTILDFVSPDAESMSCFISNIKR